jgi:hypothetical protein
MRGRLKKRDLPLEGFETFSLCEITLSLISLVFYSCTSYGSGLGLLRCSLWRQTLYISGIIIDHIN